MTTRKRGASFQADFMWKGARYRETFDTLAEAETWELEARHALRMGRPVPTTKNKRSEAGVKLHTLQQLCDHVERTHWSRQKAGDILAYNARVVVNLLGPSRPVGDISKADLDAAYADLLDAGNSPATANRKMAGISKLLTEARNNGLIVNKPVIPKQKESEGRIRWINREEETKILGMFLTWGQHRIHDFTVVAIDTGMHLSELLRIQWRDLSPDHKMLHVWESKAKIARSIPLTKRAREALMRQPRDLAGPFTDLSENGSLRTVWDRMRETLGYHDVTIHVMRHTCASRLAQTGGINLQYVQKWLGHKSITTTMRYAHLAPATLDNCKLALENYA
jgi:integrase